MTVLRVDTIAGLGQTFGPNFNGDLEFNSQNFIVLPKGSSNQQGVLRTTEDVIGVGGTYYDNLVLAMPFNEATGLRDVSSRNRNPGAYGNVAISTAQSKYYGSSAYFDGTGDFLNITGIATVGAGNSDFVIRTDDDFTIEFWENITDLSSYREIVRLGTNNASTNGSYVVVNTNGTVEFRISGFTVSTTGTVSTNTWNHISVCRQSSNVFISINGTVESLGTTTNTVTQNAAKIGSNFEENTFYQGYLQDLRIYKGLAKYTANFTPPDRIAEIGVGFKSGALRYNTDSNLPELYDGNQWVQLSVSQVGLGTGGDTEPGARGIFAGGQSANTNRIDYINISSTGNAQDFGDLTQARLGTSGFASNTRGVICGGYPFPSAVVGTIEYITISSTGDSIDSTFDLSAGRTYFSTLSNSTRGISVGGDPAGGGTEISTIEYVTIASLGNAVNFGTLTQARRYLSSCASSVRGVVGGGDAVTPASAYQNTIDFITISTLGNAFDFGDLTRVVNNLTSCSNSTRGLFAGGYQPGAQVNTIDYITISATGNTVDFGDLTVNRAGFAACSSPTRAVFCGGYNGGGNTNTIDYVTILTQGNAVDFGDRTEAKNSFSGFSNAHGGL